MSLLAIRVLGDPILRRATTPVQSFTPALQQLIDDMFETMHAAKGVGLAAPQVGRSERLTVVDVHGARHVLINPEIIEREGEIVLRPHVAVPADQAWFWTERWQEMEREANDAIAAGRVAVVEGVDELLADLDS